MLAMKERATVTGQVGFELFTWKFRTSDAVAKIFLEITMLTILLSILASALRFRIDEGKWQDILWVEKEVECVQKQKRTNEENHERKK